MFYNLIEDYSEVISEVDVSDFREYDRARSLIAKVIFRDRSTLYIRDYIFLNGERKYSYHWQDKYEKLIVRWDNSPHHPHIRGFPHHKHLPDEITNSSERHLQEIFAVIREKISRMLKES